MSELPMEKSYEEKMGHLTYFLNQLQWRMNLSKVTVASIPYEMSLEKRLQILEVYHTNEIVVREMVTKMSSDLVEQLAICDYSIFNNE